MLVDDAEDVDGFVADPPLPLKELKVNPFALGARAGGSGGGDGTEATAATGPIGGAAMSNLNDNACLGPAAALIAVNAGVNVNARNDGAILGGRCCCSCCCCCCCTDGAAAAIGEEAASTPSSPIRALLRENREPSSRTGRTDILLGSTFLRH